MSVDAFRAVPIIDCAPWLAHRSDAQPPPAALAVCEAMHVACRDVGFFYIVGHDVPPAAAHALEAQSRIFFDLPVAAKLECAMSRGGRAWRGYFPVGDELTSGRPDLKEGLYCGTELAASDPRAGVVPLHGANVFPDDGVPGLRPAVLGWMAHCARLAEALLEALAVGLLGLAHRRYFVERFAAEPTQLFRVFRYPAPAPDAAARDEWGVREHTDYGILTLLRQDQSGGLQVKSWDGVWVDAPPLRESFVVNIGDMLELWTRGLYRATPHRVRNAAAHDRYSWPFFFDPSFDAPLGPIDTALLPPWPAGRPPADARWDGASMDAVQGTYGQFVVAKVARVFPQSAEQVGLMQ